MAAETRSDRHLQRQRGAGVRELKSNFGFTFGTVSTSSTRIKAAQSQDASKSHTPPPLHDNRSPRTTPNQAAVDSRPVELNDKSVKRAGRMRKEDQKQAVVDIGENEPAVTLAKGTRKQDTRNVEPDTLHVDDKGKRPCDNLTKSAPAQIARRVGGRAKKVTAPPPTEEDAEIPRHCPHTVDDIDTNKRDITRRKPRNRQASTATGDVPPKTSRRPRGKLSGTGPTQLHVVPPTLEKPPANAEPLEVEEVLKAGRRMRPASERLTTPAPEPATETAAIEAVPEQQPAPKARKRKIPVTLATEETVQDDAWPAPEPTESRKTRRKAEPAATPACQEVLYLPETAPTVPTTRLKEPARASVVTESEGVEAKPQPRSTTSRQTVKASIPALAPALTEVTMEHNGCKTIPPKTTTKTSSVIEARPKQRRAMQSVSPNVPSPPKRRYVITAFQEEEWQPQEWFKASVPETLRGPMDKRLKFRF